MSNILYLVHRLPYPPNKGDKVRSYHLLRHLLESHRVFLGTFIDDPDDERHLPTLQAMCSDVHVECIDPHRAKVKSLIGLLTGEALTQAYYRNAGMHRWVEQTKRAHELDACVVFSSAMAQYARPLLPEIPMLVDFVDVDSAKWTQYAAAHRWPLSMLYRLEGRRLLAYERAMAASSLCSYFATPNERALFLSQAPECNGRVHAMGNGVDTEFFSPLPLRSSPFKVGEQAVVFTGAMDYWPNIDGVNWFVKDMLPRLQYGWPKTRFYVVGRNPSSQVQALANAHVVVTGTVDDVRPYLQHASAVVAPLRVARGIQNKILEAMAMHKPVITVRSCAEAVGATAEQGLLSADTPDEFVGALGALLDSPGLVDSLGRKARSYVEKTCSWKTHLSRIDSCFVGRQSVE